MHAHLAELVVPGLSPSDVRAWHERRGAFDRLVPPWASARVVQRPKALAVGETALLDLSLGPLSLRWTSTISEVDDEGFIDIAELPLGTRWRHVHKMLPHPDGCLLVDEISWDGSPWMTAVARTSVSRQVQRLLAHRHTVLAADLARWRERRGANGLVVGITGVSGSVGRALEAFLLTQGHEVLRFVRRPAPGAILWHPGPGGVEPRDIEGLDAIVHLAGESIAQRWTERALRRIEDSRVEGTAAVATAIANSARKPRLVSASAVGIYGHCLEAVDEAAPPGQGFLATVGQAWEHAAEPARQAGARVVHPRIGLVLDASHGALAGMLPAFRLGLGGPIGEGTQPFPWVARDDVLDVLADAVETTDPPAVVNVVAPEATDQRSFATALGEALGRPACVPAPSFAIRALAGAMGQALLLEGARAVPSVLLQRGHAFRWPALRPALQHAIGRPPR